MNDMLTQESGVLGLEVVRDGQTLQKTASRYSTAISVQQPRSLQSVAKRLNEEAKMAGVSFYYGWGTGKNRVVGPSIGLAMSAARIWGNCAVEPQAVQETATSYIFDAHFIDLETGFTLGRQFRQSKTWTVHGQFDDERKEDIRFQIGQSKCVRNLVCNALPKWLLDQAMDAAQAGVREGIEKYVEKNGIAKAVDAIIKSLAAEGVKEELILEKCEVAARKGLNIDHVVMLRGDLYALQEGQDRPENLYSGIVQGTAEPATSDVDADLEGDVAPRDVVPETTKVNKAKTTTSSKPKGKAAKKSSPATETEPPEEVAELIPAGLIPAGSHMQKMNPEQAEKLLATEPGDGGDTIIPDEFEDEPGDAQPPDKREFEHVGTEADPGEIVELPKDFLDMLDSSASPAMITQMRDYWTSKFSEYDSSIGRAMIKGMDAKLESIRSAARGR